MRLPDWLVGLFAPADSLRQQTPQKPHSNGVSATTSSFSKRRATGDPAALLKVYLKFNLLQEAAEFAVKLLQRNNLQDLNPIQRQKHAVLWLPHGLFDTLAERLSWHQGEGQAEAHLGPLRRRFDRMLEAHRTMAAAESHLLLQGY
mmetsp:Transcript_15097/g.25558  ORF Transcript_15097/g.25558 Transcript_15097/m.25558 type:complete len:146 (+) Transcript_15097:3-440(+)